MTRLTLLPLLAVCALALSSAAPGTAPRAVPGPEEAAALAARPAPLERPVRGARRATIGERAARLAPRWLGVPYRSRGTGPSGFDCSGFTRFVYGKLGVDLPHNAAAQFGEGRPVPRGDLRPGDLVFFHGLGHVGLYVGDGRMIHAPQSGDRVEIVRLADHYGERLVGARRVVAA